MLRGEVSDYQAFDPGRVISPLIEEMAPLCTILVTRVTLLGLLAEGALKFGEIASDDRASPPGPGDLF